MTTTLRFFAFWAFLAISPVLLAQDCGCSQCELPIVADYSRTFELYISNAANNNLANTQQGVCEVEIDFAHDFLSDLKIILISPSGQSVQLVSSNAVADTTYFSRWKIKFKPCGNSAIPDPGLVPDFDDNLNWPQNGSFGGNYYPASGCLESFNTGTVNGTWRLEVSSNGYRGVGFIYGFKITFCQPLGITCSDLNYPVNNGDLCEDATPFPTDISSYIGNTAPFFPDNALFYCGTIENNQWFWFVAQCSQILIGVIPGYCIKGDGIQLALYEECSSFPIICVPGQQGCGFCPQYLLANVVPNKKYYLMIDGFAGDHCDFQFSEINCVSTTIGTPDSLIIPHGCSDAQHTVALKEPVFGAAGYIWSANNGALVNGQTETIVVGPENISVALTLGTADGEVCVRAYNFTDTSDMVCLPFTVDTNMYLVENGVLCYNEMFYHSQYEDYGVPPLSAAGTYNFLLQNYYTAEGYLYPCDVHLEVNVTVEGSFSQLPAVVALGSQYTFPNGDIVTSSGPHFWSDQLPSGCLDDHLQSVYLIDVLQNEDGCLPDTVTFIMPGLGVSLECPGGSPPVVFGAGMQQVVYQSPGTFDLLAHFSGQSFLFADTLTIQPGVSTQGAFSSTTDVNVVTFSNQSQNALSYLWDFGDGNTSSEANPVHSYSGSGTYTVSLTAIGVCGNATVTHVVEILASLPQAALLASNNSGCQPLQVQFSDASTGNPTGWNWQFPGGDPASSTEQNPSVIYLNPGNYDVTLTVSNQLGQSSTTQTALVSVAAVPTAVFTYSSSLSTVVFSNQSQNALSYLWDFGDGNTSSEANPVHSYSGSGTYTVSLTAIGVCGNATVTHVVEISASLPQAALLASNNSGCQPLQVQFSDASTGNPTGWNWQFPGGDPASSTEQNPSVIYLNPGNYDVTLTVSNQLGQSSTTQTALVSVAAVPTAGFTYSTNLSTVVFSNQSQNALSYVWDFGDPDSGAANSSTEDNPTHVFSSPGTYLVVLQSVNTCGTSFLQQWVTITGEAPVANFSAEMPEGCAPLSVQFNDLSTGNPSTWSWSFPGANPSNSMLQNPLVTYSQPGIYPVMLTVENASGTSTATKPNFVYVDDVPTANFSTVIAGGLVHFQPLSTNGEVYTWNFGDPGSGVENTSDEPSPSHLYAVSGTYTVTLVVGNACGLDTVSQTVVVQLSGTTILDALQWLQIMPNPSNGHIQLELRDAPSASLQWRLYNALGQHIAQGDLGAFTGYTVEKMDFSHLPAALYLLEVRTAEKRGWVRLVLE